MTRILDTVNAPADLKKVAENQLEQLAREIRELLIDTVSQNGGHLASSLGVVELTIALHRIFNSPEDKLIWDVGHQSYAHKLLTGRKEYFATLRQHGGLSGFPDREESPHDAFVAGHAGNSISAALGMALARDLSGQKFHSVAIIGDGSLGAGMALEAVNHAGHLGTKVIVVLNDNGMAISPSVGAVARWLNQVRFDPRYESAKRTAQKTLSHLPFGDTAWSVSKRIKNRVERVILPGALWESLGFIYLGPVDGHNIRALEAALVRARDFESTPTLVHVITQKGKGFAEAETDAVKFHGVSPNGTKSSASPSYSQVFGKTMLQLMERNEKVVAITAAMLDGTGLAPVAARFPGRVFDVGICEQHAVTLAAGLATQGLVPVVAVYSTFLQRAYDQIVHDVCLQKLPVVFAIDRAGIVGDDGKTHQGAFDISYLRGIPNIIIAAPKDEREFQQMLFTAATAGQPMAIRYPRGSTPLTTGGSTPLINGRGDEGITLSQEPESIPIGKGEILREGEDLAIFAIGSTVYPALAAAERLAKEGVSCSVFNARFAKPLDEAAVRQLAVGAGRVATVEESALAGGFGSAVLETLSRGGLQAKVECIGLPDRFIEHGEQELVRSMLDLDADGIARRIRLAFPELGLKVRIGKRSHEGKR